MRRASVRALALLLPLLAAPRASAAQSGTAQSSSAQSGTARATDTTRIPADRVLRVAAESVTVLLTFTGAGTARLEARTARGAFALATDAATLGSWAVAAVRLPAPEVADDGAPRFSGIALGDADHGTSASLSRLTAEEHGDYQLVLAEGERRAVARLDWRAREALLLALLGIDPAEPLRQLEQWPVYHAFQVAEPARLDLERSMSPEYPWRRLDGKESGQVIFQLVVDPEGRPRMDSFEAVAATHEDFTDAVQRAVAGWRFAAALRDGAPVAQLVQASVRFSAGETARVAITLITPSRRD